MRPIDVVELAAERIGGGPQLTYEVFEALRDLRAQGVGFDTVRDLWAYLGEDVRRRPGGEIGASQMLNALLNRAAREIRAERVGPVQLGALRAAAA